MTWVYNQRKEVKKHGQTVHDRQDYLAFRDTPKACLSPLGYVVGLLSRWNERRRNLRDERPNNYCRLQTHTTSITCGANINC